MELLSSLPCNSNIGYRHNLERNNTAIHLSKGSWPKHIAKEPNNTVQFHNIIPIYIYIYTLLHYMWIYIYMYIITSISLKLITTKINIKRHIAEIWQFKHSHMDPRRTFATSSYCQRLAGLEGFFSIHLHPPPQGRKSQPWLRHTDEGNETVEIRSVLRRKM